MFGESRETTALQFEATGGSDAHDTCLNGPECILIRTQRGHVTNQQTDNLHFFFLNSGLRLDEKT